MIKKLQELSYSFLEEVMLGDPIKVIIACTFKTSLDTDYRLLYQFYHSTIMRYAEREEIEEKYVKEYVHFMLRMACMIEAAHKLAQLQGTEHFTYSFPGTDI
jgi:hypothetical protein